MSFYCAVQVARGEQWWWVDMHEVDESEAGYKDTIDGNINWTLLTISKYNETKSWRVIF